MKDRPARRTFATALVCTCLASAIAVYEPSIAADANGLTRLDGPKGGVVVYGPAPSGPTSAPAAMGAVLRALHAQFAARPEVGRVFELKGSDSIALHFVVQPPNAPARAGMIVVAPNGRGGYETGVVSDEASRLQTSFNPMLQTLFASWHPPGAGAPERSGRPPMPLRPYELPDRTASVALPDGWRVTPGSGGGSIFASGPRGERVALGYTLLVIDTSVPAGRQLQQQAMGPLRNTSYANNLYYPYGQPLGKTYVDLLRMERQRTRQQPAPMRLVSEEPAGQQGGSRCARLRGEVAPHDDMGPTAFDTVFCAGPPERSANGWLTVAYTSVVPVAQADEERATLSAIVASFHEDRAAIQRMANQMAAPGIAAIHEIGRLATQRAAEADATRIGMRQSYEARSNAQDRSSQAFSNYIRDQTVVVDRDTNAHGTVWNKTADSMVQNDPRRFGYVDTPNFWKGVDY